MTGKENNEIWKKSGKIHVIDQATFEEIKKQSKTENSHKITNSKYKRFKSQFSLLNYVEMKKARPTKSLYGGWSSKSSTNTKKLHHGKTREGGRKRHCTKLKKSILRYRQLKRSEASVLLDTVKLMENLTIHSRKFRK